MSAPTGSGGAKNRSSGGARDRDRPVGPASEHDESAESDDDLLDWMGVEAPVEDFGRGRYSSQATSARRAPDAVAYDDEDPYDEFLVGDGRRRNEVRIPRRGGWLRRLVFSAGTLGIIALLVAGGSAYWLFRQVDPPGEVGAPITLSVPDGATGDEITTLLADNDIVANDKVFRQYIRVRGQDEAGRFKSGVYTFNINSSMSEALSSLERGPIPPKTVTVTIPEGLRVIDALDSIATQVPWFDRAKLQTALDSGAVPSRFRPADRSYEGLLFPDTYELIEGTTEVEFLTTMAQQFDKVAAQLGVDKSLEKLGYTPYDVVVMASMIEREARVAEDRPKIARVMFNRLASDTRLDIDATVLYALDRTNGGLTETDLEVDSPYNTRRNKGLPPTPIAMPGRASLEAVMVPANGNWLYYVLADANGTHFFTGSYNEFLAAVAEAEEKGLI